MSKVEDSASAPQRPTQRELSKRAAALKATKNAKKAAVTGGSDRLLSKTEVCLAVGKTFATLWAWMRSKPARFSLSARFARIARLVRERDRRIQGDASNQNLSWRRQARAGAMAAEVAGPLWQSAATSACEAAASKQQTTRQCDLRGRSDQRVARWSLFNSQAGAAAQGRSNKCLISLLQH